MKPKKMFNTMLNSFWSSWMRWGARGTSTFDGLAIAWAISEYLYNVVKAKAIFATHYHQLTQLEGVLPGVKNYNMAVKEEGGSIIFLRSVVPGATDKSYGVHVAKLAGPSTPSSIPLL
jgi:DNA mismatch repair protein MutS